MKRFLLVILILLLGLEIGCYQDNHIISKEQRKAYTVTELKDLFDVYRDDYIEVADIVLRNKYLKQAMINSKEGVVSFETTTVRDRFSENEWFKIETLFRNTGLFRIERNSKGNAKNDTVKFLYRTSNYTTTLYYCQTDDESDMEYYELLVEKFETIERNWWIGYSEDIKMKRE